MLERLQHPKVEQGMIMDVIRGLSSANLDIHTPYMHTMPLEGTLLPPGRHATRARRRRRRHDSGYGRAGVKEDFPSRLNRVTQLTGLSDPVYAEAYVTVHSYDILLEVLLINQRGGELSLPRARRGGRP